MSISTLVRPVVLAAAVAAGLFLTAPDADARPRGYGRGQSYYGNSYSRPAYSNYSYARPYSGYSNSWNGRGYNSYSRPFYNTQPGLSFQFGSGFNSFNSFNQPRYSTWGW